MEETSFATVSSVARILLVAAYIRVSTDEQKLRGISLDSQRMHLEKYAQEHNMKIVEWYVDEGVSGRKPIAKRPELQRMIQDAEKGKFEQIIFVKLDRFFRSVREYHECMRRIEPVEWVATEEDYDLTTAQGRMLVNMKITIAEMEADTGSERVRMVNDYKIANGQWLSGNCTFGFTYALDKETGKRRVMKDPKTQHIVEDMLRHVMLHQSIKSTMWHLKETYGIDMHYSNLSKYLKKPILYGSYRGNSNFCEGYMTKEEWDKMQNVTRRNVRQNTTENRAYWFSGLIRCPECGRLLKGGVYTGTRKGGGHYVYKQYRCQNKHFSAGRCSFGKSIFENTFERMLLSNIEDLLKDAEVQSVKVAAKNAKKAKPDVDKINEQIDRLNYSWRTGKIRTIEQYEKDFEELNKQLHDALVGSEHDEVRDYTHIREVLSGGWKKIYKALDDEHKRSFWRSIIESIEVEWTSDVKRIKSIKFF
jgi:DNA invertase Pin-like site-specific DNA recombinase